MPHSFNEEKYSFAWFKEKVVETLIGLACAGIVGLIGFAFVQAYLGDYKFEKLKADFQTEIRKMKNQQVEREGDIMKAIQELKDKQSEAPSLPSLPPAPILGPSVPNVQQHPDSAKLNWIENHREKD